VRSEPECEYYDLYDQVNGNRVFVEAWSTRELWMIHNDAETVKTINAGVEGKLLKPVFVKELYASN
jgi:quinol monooxygenase YgiN